MSEISMLEQDVANLIVETLKLKIDPATTGTRIDSRAKAAVGPHWGRAA